MNRIDATFARLRAAGRTALIPYVTAGDPSPAATVPIMSALVTAGADVVELGVPFSDPMADGPVIQRASERALAQGVGLATVLALVGAFRKTDATTPVVLMGYANPIEAMGTDDVRGPRAGGRSRRRAGRRLSAGGGRGIRGAAGGAGPRADLPAGADDAGGAHRRRREDRARLRLLCFAERGDRRRSSGHRRGRAQARGDPAPRAHSRRRRLRDPRRGERAGAGGGRRCGRHRQSADPGDRVRGARAPPRNAPGPGSRASALRSIRCGSGRRDAEARPQSGEA